MEQQTFARSSVQCITNDRHTDAEGMRRMHA